MHILSGSASRLSGTVALADAARIIRGGSNERVGRSVAVLQDADGDGLAEVAVGSPGGTGNIHVLTDLTASGIYATADADALLMAEAIEEGAGSDLLAPGDLDGDGYDELVIGAEEHDALAGRVYVWMGSTTMWTGSTILADAQAQLTSPSAEALFGSTLMSGDYDSDGVQDPVVGAPAAQGGTLAGAGLVLVYSGDTVSGVVPSESAIAELHGSYAEAAAGASLATGDANGDGIDDLLVGADGGMGTAAGIAFLVYGGELP